MSASVSVSSVCQVSQYVNSYNEESSLCLLGPTYGILSAFLFNFANKKSALHFKLLLLYSAICLNTPYNISTCGFFKSWSVEFKSKGLNFSSFFERLSINEIEQSIGQRLTLIRCRFISSFLSVIEGR